MDANLTWFSRSLPLMCHRCCWCTCGRDAVQYLEHNLLLREHSQLIWTCLWTSGDRKWLSFMVSYEVSSINRSFTYYAFFLPYPFTFPSLRFAMSPKYTFYKFHSSFSHCGYTISTLFILSSRLYHFKCFFFFSHPFHSAFFA